MMTAFAERVGITSRASRLKASLYNIKIPSQEVARVPLLVRVPRQPPKRITQRVGLVDIMPTLLELTGTKFEPGAKLDGQSLVIPALKPELLDSARDELLSDLRD